MLFCLTWDLTDQTEENEARALQVFANWQPPAGADFKGFYGFADGAGGMALIEVEDAETLQRVMAPWTPWLRFTARVVLPIETSSAIAGEAVQFRAGVS